MKKIHYIIGALALIACSCSNENLGSVAPAPKMVTVRLSTEESPQIEEATRSMLVNKKVVWHADDAVAYTTKSGKPFKLTNIMPEGPEATFEGQLTEDVIDGMNQMVVYPYMDGLVKYQDNYSGDYGVQNIKLTSSQELLSGSFGQGYNLSVAGIEWGHDEILHFRNLCALVAVKLKGNIPVTSISIQAPENVCGTFSILKKTGTFGPDAVYRNVAMGSNSKTITLTSTDAVELAENAQTFYAVAVPFDGVSCKGEWTVSVTDIDGVIHQMAVTTTKAIAAGKITTLGEFKITGSAFSASLVTMDRNANSVELEKTKYLTGEYTVHSANDWITPSVTEKGIRIDATANTTGAGRNGTVEVKVGGEVVSTITVKQTTYDYYSFIGDYFLSYKNINNASTYANAFRIDADVEGETYRLTFAKNYTYTMKLKYGSDGLGLMSLLLPQEATTSQAGYTAQARAAKVPASGFTLTAGNYSEIDIAEEGVGYDFILDDSDGRINFTLEPNAKGKSLYGNLGGIWFLSTNGSEIVINDWIQPAGALVISKRYYGEHEGFTRK